MNNQSRSLLFVPAVENKIKKAFLYQADIIIFDLEDSIKDNRKDHSIKILVDFLNKHIVNRKVFVRLNKENIEYEIEQLEVLGNKLMGYMIPKMEEINVIDKIKNKSKKIIAVVETPCGFLKLNDIVSNKRISAVAFGAEDYCSATGMKNENNLLIPLKLEIVKYAKAYDKLCYDTISKELTANFRLKEDVQMSKKLGFTGKLAIHPCQIEIINKTFSKVDKETALKIIEKYDNSEDGVITYKGIVYEKPHIDYMRKIIKGEE